MAIRRSQKFRPTLEGMERRETPSGFGGGAHVAEMAVHAAATTSVFKGSGKVTLLQQVPLNNGGLYAVGRVTGNGSPIGPFVGVENVVFAPGLHQFRANAVLQAKDGSRLVLKIVSSTQPGATTGKGTYTIVAGNGRFTHATGTGVITGSLSLATQSLSFNFKGIIRV